MGTAASAASAAAGSFESLSTSVKAWRVSASALSTTARAPLSPFATSDCTNCSEVSAAPRSRASPIACEGYATARAMAFWQAAMT